ncbi:MAG TPA: hypothetical protein VFC65_17090 [Prolixibacteraceae bacterium]|nr:hypothetical protein [Prolixibacteraceae bacterium]
MKNICLYFQIHHPFSFQTFRYFDVGESKSWYDDSRIEREIYESATNYYLPTNDFLLRLIRQSKGKLKVSFYISGTSLDQFQIYSPKLLSSFRQLADTGLVEFTGGLASHSIASLADNKDEFKSQIKLYKERIEYYFGQNPQVFVNSDLIFTNQIAQIVAEAGYQMILTNGAKKLLQWRSPNCLYASESQRRIGILFRNEGISNEFASMLSNPNAMKKQEQIDQLLTSFYAIRPEEPMVNIYLNYKTLGGSKMSAKQQFFRTFVFKIMKDKSFSFSRPSELTEQFGPVAEIGTEEPVCWTGHSHSSYYPGNELQKDAIKQLFKLEKQLTGIKNHDLQIGWQYLQPTDHFHLMEENHPAYFDSGSNPGIYKSKYDAFINYMNILEDFRQQLKVANKGIRKDRNAVQASVPFQIKKRQRVF